MVFKPIHKALSALAVILAWLFFLPACTPVDQSFSPDRAPESDPVQPGTHTPPSRPADARLSPGRVTGQAGAPEAEPDWRARYETLRTELITRFTAPKLGATVALKLKTDIVKSGMLVELSPEQVVLMLEDATVTYPREMLSPESRLFLMQDDFVTYHANRRLKEEQMAWETTQKHRKAEQALEQLAMVQGAPLFPRPVQTPSPKPAPAPERVTLPRGDASPPVNDPRDASVRQVKDYLKVHTRNAGSIHYLEWSRVVPHPDGYSVRCSYTVDTDSFGTITENKVFYLNKAGRVVNVSGGTQTVRKLDL